MSKGSRHHDDKGLNAGALIRDMTAELDALALTNDADLSAIASAFRAALGALEEATAWLLARYDSNPREAAAGAVPY